MKDFIESVIKTGNFRLEDMETRIKHLYVRGDLSEAELGELLALAAEYAGDAQQVDILALVADLERRVEAIESKGVTVWTSDNPTTAKGQTRLFDIDKDGVLDYVRYDGGRASTALSPGKINGWVKTDAAGNVTHTIERDGSGNIILVPVGGGGDNDS